MAFNKVVYGYIVKQIYKEEVMNVYGFDILADAYKWLEELAPQGYKYEIVHAAYVSEKEG